MKLSEEKAERLLRESFGSVYAAARAAGVTAQAFYAFMERHPHLRDVQREARETWNEDIPQAARVNVARAVLRELATEDYPHASFALLKQIQPTSVQHAGQIVVVLDWGGADEADSD